MADRERPHARARRHKAFVLGVSGAALAAVLTHLGSLAAPFFADDWLFLDQVRFRPLTRVLAMPDPLGNFFRPLSRQVWFWLLARAGGESPLAFHVANLLCLVASVVLLATLVRRAAGERAAVLAAAYLALHYAADVPVLWVSGSQELLSLAMALTALVLYQRGRRWPAAGAYLLALLAKEAVVLAPIAAIALDRSGGWRARVRRAWPLGAAALAWLALAAWVMAARGAGGAGLSLTASGPLAAAALLGRVALALEWKTHGWPLSQPTDPGALSLIAVIFAAAAAFFGIPRRARAQESSAARADAPRRGAAPGGGPRRGARPAASAPPRTAAAPAAPEDDAPARPDAAQGLRAGLLWALAGGMPVAVVAATWSAYYFLFALAGVGLVLGSLAELRRWNGAVAALVVAAMGLVSTQARGLQEFATGRSAWSPQSHVNRFYLQRGMLVISRGLADLRAQIPAPRPRTTFFFTGLPSFASFQVGDGPLVRGAYRDSSLRGYYLSQITHERLTRGPWAVFYYDMGTGRLVNRTNLPGVFLSIAASHILSDRLDVADVALEAAAAHGENEEGRTFLAALVARAKGDTTRAFALFKAAGHGLGRDAGGAEAEARRQLVSGDTLAAMMTLRRALDANVLDPAPHALLADLLLTDPQTVAAGEIEAYAARVLAPTSPEMWRRWAIVLANENRQLQSLEAFNRYFALRPAAERDDPEAVNLRDVQRRMLPGGDLAQRAILDEVQR